MKKKLQELLAKLAGWQEEFKGKPMPENIATEFDQVAAEAESLQKQLARLERAGKLVEDGKSVTDPVVPDDDQPDEAKKAELHEKKNRIVGYVSIGAYVAASKAMQKFIEAGKPNQQVPLVTLKGLHGKRIGLTADQVREFKAVPTIGDNVIIPDQADTVRVTEHDRLTLRDVLNIRPTTKDAIRYTRIVGFTRAAETVPPGDPKPEGAIELHSKLAAVYTIAVWIPVQNEQMDDLTELANIIDTELLYDVNKREEELCVYGGGTDEFLGIAMDPDVPDARTEAGDTLIDTARRAITDVLLGGYAPNAILASPLDWEKIVLEKGTDNRYIWIVVTDGATQRLWGVPVIESVATHDNVEPELGARNLIVGDFVRGATLWTRSGAVISAGFINDQFIRNQRTILAEERAAFAVRRPKAFVKHETQAATAS